MNTQATDQSIATSGSLNETETKATVLPDGRIVQTWWEEPTAGGGDLNDVYARVIDRDGTEIVSRFLVAGGASEQLQPVVAGSVDGGFAIAYNDRSVAGGQVGVKSYNQAGALVNTTNLTTGGVLSGIAASTEDANFVSITALLNGNYVVAWPDSGIDNVNAQILSSNGATVGGNIVVDVSVNQNSSTSLTPTLGGGFLLPGATRMKSKAGSTKLMEPPKPPLSMSARSSFQLTTVKAYRRQPCTTAASSSSGQTRPMVAM